MSEKSTLKKLLKQLRTLAHALTSEKDHNPAYSLWLTFRLFLSFQPMVLRTVSRLLKQPRILSKQHWRSACIATRILKRTLLSRDLPAAYSVAKSDRRFRNKAWHKQRFYFFVLQNYLLLCDHIKRLLDNLPNQELYEVRQIKFYMQVILEALSPSNFILLDPDLLAYTKKNKGQNILDGFGHYLTDLEHWNGYLHISKCDLNAYTLGDDLANTSGKIVYQNDLIELIQYKAQTEKTYPNPVLIVTSWINKYYVLDLQSHQSLIDHLVKQGYCVFAISWRSHQRDMGDRGFEDYVLQGPVAASEFIFERCQKKQINAVGYCLGGTLLTTAIAYMLPNKPFFKNLTLLASLLDFSDAGQFQCFAGPDQMRFFRSILKDDCHWDGRRLAVAFNLLRSNEFIWPFFVRSYCRGQKPVSNASLYWFQDFCHNPKSLYLFYMEQLLQKNLLCQKKITIKDKIIDLSSIDLTNYILAVYDDHVSPWQSTLQNVEILNGDSTVIVCDGGHVSGIINSPTKTKYQYWTHEQNILNTQEALDNATRQRGSWWPHWLNWLDAQQTRRVLVKRFEHDWDQFPTDAPGNYVHEQVFSK